jgi:hypothetical protein
LSNIATPAKKIPSPIPPLPVGQGSPVSIPLSVEKGSLTPLISGLTYKGKLSINEQRMPKFEKYAPGMIRFDLRSFHDFSLGTSFKIQCEDHTGAIFFKTCAIMEERGNLNFFIPNLPFGKEITVTVHFTAGTSSIMRIIKLNIEQTAGLYTIQENNLGNGLKYESATLGNSQVLDPFLLEDRDLVPLAESFTLQLDANGKAKTPVTDSFPFPRFFINNLGERSVIYLQLVSGHCDVNIDARAVTVPVVIGAGKTACFSLSLLQDIWATQYEHATRKSRPEGDLHLCLGGHHQIVYPESMDSHS